MTEYAVMAETHEGNVFALRYGFASQEAAEGHPVKLSLWKRMWVEERNRPTPLAHIEHSPPLPWSMEWIGTFTYVRDAEGRRVLSLFGSAQRRAHTEDVLRRAGLLSSTEGTT